VSRVGGLGFRVLVSRVSRFLGPRVYLVFVEISMARLQIIV
jgi:hypothetical protein